MDNWKQYAHKLSSCLEAISVWDAEKQELDWEAGFTLWRQLTYDVRSKDRCVFIVGNGASASMASHVAVDIAKNAGVHTQAFMDASLITAMANDYCYEKVFAEPLRRWMKQGDMLVAISSSGNSPNIINAVQTAKELGGHAITLSAMRENNSIRAKGDLNFYLPAQTYGLAESGHAAILHYWIDLVVENS